MFLFHRNQLVKKFVFVLAMFEIYLATPLIYSRCCTVVMFIRIMLDFNAQFFCGTVCAVLF